MAPTAAPIANAAAGPRWTLGNYVTLTSVTLASLPATCVAGAFAVINDGVGFDDGCRDRSCVSHQWERVGVSLMAPGLITIAVGVRS
jgi:hypothetical protein